MKKKGFFLMEEIIVLTIFSLLISITLPMIKNSLKIKRIIKKEIKYNRNFIYIMENILEEIKNSKRITILKNGNQILIEKNILENEKLKTIKIYYTFIGSYLGKQFIRKVYKNEKFFKDDIVYDNVTGHFFEEDGYIKLKIIYNQHKEEYIWK